MIGLIIIFIIVIAYVIYANHQDGPFDDPPAGTY